jgi:hypothetical protein
MRRTRKIIGLSECEFIATSFTTDRQTRSAALETRTQPDLERSLRTNQRGYLAPSRWANAPATTVFKRSSCCQPQSRKSQLSDHARIRHFGRHSSRRFWPSFRQQLARLTGHFLQSYEGT